jgi:hypothetical protein
MITTNEIQLITVPVIHYGPNDVITKEDVDFQIYREANRFRAIPLMAREERLTTGLPEELVFVYVSHCIASANDMEEESLNAIKQIILELEVQELL